MDIFMFWHVLVPLYVGGYPVTSHTTNGANLSHQVCGHDNHDKIDRKDPNLRSNLYEFVRLCSSNLAYVIRMGSKNQLKMP